jgi:hypothetical protein
MYTRHNTQKPVTGIPLRPDEHWSKDGLVGCWLMNEGSGNKVYDLSGNRHDGTLTNGPTWKSGKHGSTIDFVAASSHYIDCGNRAKLDLTGDLTFVIACRQDFGSNGHYFLLDKASYNSAGYELWRDNGNKFRFRTHSAGNASTYTATNYSTAGVNLQIAVVKNGTSVNFYVNGVDDTGTAGTHIIAAPTGDNFIIGAQQAIANEWDGLIEYVYVYDYALTASEIQDLYIDPFCMIYTPEQLSLYGGYVTPVVGNAGIMTLNTGLWGPTF